MSAGFEVGELVDVAIKAARVVQAFPGTLVVSYGGADDSTRNLAINLEAREVSVGRLAPKEWPPRPGDVWRNEHGVTLFASAVMDDYVELRSSRGDLFETARGALEHVGPLSLAYREGWTPETSPAGRDTESSPGGPAVATTGQPVDHRAATIAGLRELADWLETNPAVPVDKNSAELSLYAWQTLGTGYYAGSDEEQAAVLRRVGALIGADVAEGQHGGPHGRVVKKFAGGVKYELLHVWQAAPTPVDTDVTQAGEVAGPDGDAGPATAADETAADAAEPEHGGAVE